MGMQKESQKHKNQYFKQAQSNLRGREKQITTLQEYLNRHLLARQSFNLTGKYNFKK